MVGETGGGVKANNDITEACLGVVVVAGAVVYEASGAGLILEAEMALAPEAVNVA